MKWKFNSAEILILTAISYKMSDRVIAGCVFLCLEAKKVFFWACWTHTWIHFSYDPSVVSPGLFNNPNYNTQTDPIRFVIKYEIQQLSPFVNYSKVGQLDLL